MSKFKKNRENFLKDRICNCEASLHDLLGNCLSCGRIICSKQGNGPCLTCGTVFKSSSHIALSMESMEKCPMKVVDDQGDYFNVDSRWLTDEQRQKLKVLEEEQKIEAKKPTYSIDLRKGKISSVPHESDILQKIEEIFRKPEPTKSQTTISFNRHNLRFQESTLTQVHSSRVQDDHLIFPAETCQCLSIHQPYASLLVAGIKKEEYRKWYTDHRGRLWIHASASHKPDATEIAQVEYHFSSQMEIPISMPREYPLGCIVGCVRVSDCVLCDEADEDSGYAIVCECPLQLKGPKIPIKPSGPRIFSLEGHVIRALNKLID
ncbi:hypothetical protein ACOME3_006160 [Neoechinorhynchus agilis]